MDEVTLRGEKTDDAVRTVQVLVGFRFGGQGYGPGVVTSFPGRIARELVLHGRARWAERPMEVRAQVALPEVRVPAAPVVATPLRHVPLVAFRRVGNSRWFEILVDGVVVGKKNGQKAAERERDRLIAEQGA